MDFIDSMKNTLKEENNVSITENGAIGYKTTHSALLDMNFKITSYRNLDDAAIIEDFSKCWKENKELSLKFLFYIRDILQGCGERRLFKVILKWLAVKNEFPSELIKEIPAYGRYDDLEVFWGTSYEAKMLEFIDMTLSADITNMQDKKSVSLLAKWLPSINTSSKDSVSKAYKIARSLEMSPSQYRKLLSTLRKYIDVVEVKMSANEWDKIKYESVPSQANKIYKEAFNRHDLARRTQFLSKVISGETTIKAATLAPHEIVAKYSRDSIGCWSWSGPKLSRKIDLTLEGLWKNLPTNFEMNNSTLVVCDGSGSMCSTINGTTIKAIEVSNALAIYFAERCSGSFKNKFITFSSRPHIVDISSAQTLLEKLKISYSNDDCSNTDIEATFDLILKTAIQNNCSQDDLPKQVLIVSDMEFDSATWSYSSSLKQMLFQQIAQKFAQAGYKMPKLVFWNVMSRTNTIPIKENELGVALVSGFSPNTMKMIMSAKTDPYELLVDLLMSDRYTKIVYKA